MSADDPVVQCRGVIKDYRGLRPLRLLDLRVAAGERVVLSGIDVIGAEVVTNLINGATLPDEGEVRVFGQADARNHRRRGLAGRRSITSASSPRARCCSKA